MRSRFVAASLRRRGRSGVHPVRSTCSFHPLLSCIQREAAPDPVLGGKMHASQSWHHTRHISRARLMLAIAGLTLTLCGSTFAKQASAWACYYPQVSGSACTAIGTLDGSSGWSNTRLFTSVKISNFSAQTATFQIWINSSVCNGSVCKFPTPTTSYSLAANSTTTGSIACPAGIACKVLLFETSAGSRQMTSSTQ